MSGCARYGRESARISVSFSGVLHDLDFLQRQAVEGIDVEVDLLFQRARVRLGIVLLRREDAVNEGDDGA